MKILDKLLHPRVATSFAYVTLMVLTIVIGSFLWILEQDINFVPIQDVTTQAVTVKPGEIARIIFTYTRMQIPRKLVIDSRTLVCDDGTQWNVESLVELNSSWPSGVNQKATVAIDIPTNVSSPQTCYYSSQVWYYRYILPPLLVKMPPSSTLIFIEETD